GNRRKEDFQRCCGIGETWGQKARRESFVGRSKRHCEKSRCRTIFQIVNCETGSKKPKPEFPPLLPAGKHVLSEADLRQLTVENFSASSRRIELWQSLKIFCDDLRRENIVPARIW